MERFVGATVAGESRLEGRDAFITGGTKNIGRANARAFVAAGVDVVITARTGSGLRETKSELESVRAEARVLTVVADVSNEPDITRSVDAALNAFGGVNILVNNAYFSGRQRGRRAGLETSLDEWDSTSRGNVMAPFRYVQLLEPAMRKRGGGSIINMLSIAATGFVDGLPAYAPPRAHWPRSLGIWR